MEPQRIWLARLNISNLNFIDFYIILRFFFLIIQIDSGEEQRENSTFWRSPNGILLTFWKLKWMNFWLLFLSVI